MKRKLKNRIYGALLSIICITILYLNWPEDYSQVAKNDTRMIWDGILMLGVLFGIYKMIVGKRIKLNTGTFLDSVFDESTLEEKWIKNWLKEGKYFIKKNNFNEAIKCFDFVLEENSKHAESWVLKSIALRNVNRFKEADECFEMFLKYKNEQTKNNSHVHLEEYLIDGWMDKGAYLFRLGKYNDAIGCYNSVLKIKTEYNKALYFKGRRNF